MPRTGRGGLPVSAAWCRTGRRRLGAHPVASSRHAASAKSTVPVFLFKQFTQFIMLAPRMILGARGASCLLGLIESAGDSRLSLPTCQYLGGCTNYGTGLAGRNLFRPSG